jgi:ribosomal protein S18 acetylase RimI-like enzyme
MPEFSIRPATAADIPALAHITAEGWRASYDGVASAEWLASLNETELQEKWKNWFGAESWNVLYAEEQEGGAGFISFGKLKTPPPGSSPIRPPYAAEIYAIYLLPEARGTGLAIELMKQAALALREKKVKSLCLWVVDKNARANAFYKKLGGERIGKKDIRIGDAPAREVCYGWRDTARLVEAA